MVSHKINYDLYITFKYQHNPNCLHIATHNYNTQNMLKMFEKAFRVVLESVIMTLFLNTFYKWNSKVSQYLNGFANGLRATGFPERVKMDEGLKMFRILSLKSMYIS